MRINELIESPALGRAKNKATRYNTEVGLLCGLCGVDPATFDPANPQNSIPSDKLENGGAKVYKDIVTFLAPNFDPTVFQEWAAKAPDYMAKVSAKLGHEPQVFAWAGGHNFNVDGAADIEFVGEEIQGISVKAETGITLRNLTPKALGLTVERGNDVFFQYAADEYRAMKSAIFQKVLDTAKASPGEQMAWHRESQDKYWIKYNTPTVTQPADQIGKNKPVTKPPVDTNTPQVGQPIGHDPEAVNEDVGAEGTWTCMGKSSFTGTRQQIMAAVVPNKKWHRVFGDWFQANYSTEQQLAKPLYSAVSNMFKDIMVNHLAKDRQLDSVLAMGHKPYFYVNDVNIFYVPSVTEVSDLTLKNVYYGTITDEGDVKEAEGTSQKFQAEIGRPESTENARILIYIRYANGMFACNPTVRVQDLKNPQFLGWEEL